jgi:hypothetical protein
MSISERAIGFASKRSDVGTLCADCPARSRKPRSYQQHKRYFAMLRAVHFQWPETHERQFPNRTALRKWAQMKAGHHTTKTVDLYGIPMSKARLIVQSALEGAAPYSEAVVQGRNLVIFSPLSINYDTLGHKEFCRLNDEVDGVIRAETGLDPDAVLKGTERAA